jgi:hypothetical protein
VYGPLATVLQAVASWAGGDSLRLTVFVLALFNAAAFIATGLLIDRFTRDDPTRRLRAALLWTANPLLLYQLVAGMHVDTLAVACMVAALIAKDRPVGSGLLLGAGVAVKLNAGIVALGPAWELRRRPGRLAVMAGCAVAVVAAGYAVVGAAALEPLTRSSKSVSLASMWDPVKRLLQATFGSGGYRAEIQIASLLLLALVAVLVARVTGEVAAAVAVAYVFTAPYVLPWYDALAFGVLALVAASAVDRFAVAHLTALSLAYLPARVEGQPAGLLWLRDDLRPLIGWVSLLLTLALAAWAWRAGGRVRRPRASAAPPPSAP